ncbi:ABC transporter ATP-binding protein [Lacticaseibacillus hegangensis]|uniref:ATP-binding cassette domain-containing protein n=1 Tax=Lacticaseibacillus hegangensis TaxID=2486010 RepID=A0ABW4CWS9_9LACO|nr:ABC transporter ATP-binding protein [Lacticaseibacillus hegangensis]
MLAVSGLTFAFKRKPILADVSFTLADGQITGLVAPNGTGKTTLLRLLCGLLPISQAHVLVNGIDQQQKHTQFLKQLFFLESSSNLYPDLTVQDHLRYVKRVWQSPVDIGETVASLGMQSYAKTRIKRLSLGMKQHALLAMYIVSNAQTMLIDEPLNGLDPSSIQQFEAMFRQLREEGKTLLVSSHQMDSVGRVCDQVFFLKNQKLDVLPNDGQDMMAEYTKRFLTEAS